MLRPIPARILRSTATVKYCSFVDEYQNQSYTEETVERVHLQPCDKVVKTVTNTDYKLTGILFVDARISTPQIDWRQYFAIAHENGGDMRVVIRDIEYTVVSVDELRDDTDQLHHWEIGVV